MKNSIMVLFLLTFSVSIFSQDLIITDEGDTLNCKITKVKDENIYFTFKHKEEIRNTMLPLYRVQKYEYGYFQQGGIPENRIPGYQDYQKFRFVINSGWSYRIAPVEEKLQSFIERYFKELKSGYHLSSDMQYYFTEFFGFGIKYSLYRSSNMLDNVQVTFQDGSQEVGRIKDDISIHFIGPSFYIRYLSGNKKNALYSGLSIGRLGYKNNAIIIDEYILTGKTIGITWDIGYDLSIHKNVSLGILFSYTSGTLTEYEVDDGSIIETVELDKENYDNLSRIDLSAGLRVNF